MESQEKQKEEQREREQIKESGGGHRTPDPGPQKGHRYMTLKEFRESYHNATGKASDLTRSINYSLIAIVWVLCGQDIEKVSSYQCVLIWLLLSLATDYVQYLIMAFVGMIKYRCEERNVKDKSKIDETPTNGYPEITPYLTTVCFVLKIVFAFVAVCYLMYKLANL